LRLFARIGPTPESAKWYLLPSDWNTAVSPSGQQITLEVQPYTDFVIHLNERNNYELLERLAPTRKPTRSERREMKRAENRARRGWGMSAAEARKTFRQLALWWFLGIGAVALFLVCAALTDWIVYRLLFLPLALLDLYVVVIVGARIMDGLLRTWRDGGQAGASVQTIEGLVTRSFDLNPSANREHSRAIVWLELPDGSSRPFAVGPRILDRLPPAGRRLRVS
jgi:hypothetical protein